MLIYHSDLCRSQIKNKDSEVFRLWTTIFYERIGEGIFLIFVFGEYEAKYKQKKGYT
jgi:hypothetical protein